ncbi:MAG: hypothetical protein SF187_11365 [Deltaproteobacteria bacterium]|nr:hypothetical protein [Deltaproteobacteria bacterium]
MTQSIKLRAVLEGDDMMVAVEGGYIRRAAPEDGLVVATGADEMFLPEGKIVEALRALQTARDGDKAAKPAKRASQMELTAAPVKKISGGS